MEQNETNNQIKPSLKRTGTLILESNDNQNPKKQKSSVITRYPSHLFASNATQKTQISDADGINDWLQKYLPYNILLDIFSLLSRAGLINSSRTCKYFRKVASDPVLQWATFLTLNLKCRSLISNSVTPEFLGDPFRDQAFEITPEPFRGPRWEVKEHGVLMFYGCFEPDYGTWVLEDLFRNCRSQTRSDCRFFLKYPGDLTMNQVSFKVYFQVNVKSVELFAQNRIHLSCWEMVAKRSHEEEVKIAAKKIQTFIGNKSAAVPFKSLIAPKQPSGLKDGINLYKYQLDAVRWMSSVELDIAAKIPFKYVALHPWRQAKTEILIECALVPGGYGTLNFSAIPPNKFGHYIQSFYPAGGVLADEMGLGKTIEILGLILSNPRTAEQQTEAATHNSVVENVEKAEIDRLRFKSKATLVACPNHLIQQWHDEIMKFTDPPLKIRRISALHELKSCSYEDLISADVVIVSLQFLKSAGYQNFGRRPQKGSSKSKKKTITVDIDQRQVRSEKMLKKVRAKMAEGNELDDAPMFEHFQWHRIVIDEAHEVVADDEYQDVFSLLRAKFYWYVSGTPIPSTTVLDGILEFLEFPDDPAFKHVYADMFWNNLYWRNTKESVQDEYAVPEVVEDLVLLDFTETEKIMYQLDDNTGKHQQFKKQLCSQLPKIGSCQTLSEITVFKIAEQKKLIKGHRTNLFQLKLQRDEISASLPAVIASSSPYGYNWFLENLNSQLRKLTDDIKAREEGIQKAQEALKLFQSVVSYQDRLKGITHHDDENEEEEDGTEDFPREEEIEKMTVTQMKDFVNRHSVTPQGTRNLLEKQMKHLIQFLRTENEEKLERKKLRQAEKKEIKTSENTWSSSPQKKAKKAEKANTENNNNSEAPDELMDLVENLGTKMGNLIHYLKSLWKKDSTARIIIFSQFDSVLSQVDNILSQYGIHTVSVKGADQDRNVNQKTGALSAFKAADSDVKVILLSLAKAASGSNLIEASHVVLIDPISGTKEEIQAVESQAIGRAYRQGQSQHVTVVRFLIKGTTEHHMYLKTYLPDGQGNKDAPKVLNRAGSALLFKASSVAAVVGNGPEETPESNDNNEKSLDEATDMTN